MRFNSAIQQFDLEGSRCQPGLEDSQTSRSWTDKSRTLRSRTSRSPDIQVPGHPGPRTSRSFGHPGLSDFQVPGHPGPRTSKSFGHPGPRTSRSFGHPGPRTSRSFGLPGLILNCQNVRQVMFPHQSVQVSQRSQVSRVALCMSKVEVLWQGYILSCSGQVKKMRCDKPAWITNGV